MLKVAIFDDMVAARGETFHIPGLEVTVYAHADDVLAQCLGGACDLVCMDFSMGKDRQTGADAIRALRAAGFTGRIVAMSSDPSANAAMKDAGADEALGQKAYLRSYLVHVGATHLRDSGDQGS